MTEVKTKSHFFQHRPGSESLRSRSSGVWWQAPAIMSGIQKKTNEKILIKLNYAKTSNVKTEGEFK